MTLRPVALQSITGLLRFTTATHHALSCSAGPATSTTAATPGRCPATGSDRPRTQAKQPPGIERNQAGGTRPPAAIGCAQGRTDHPLWGDVAAPRAVETPHITRPKNPAALYLIRGIHRDGIALASCIRAVMAIPPQVVTRRRE